MVKQFKIGQYVGEYRHNLTDKNRLALPKQIRIEIDGFEVMLSKGFDSCILGYDLRRWKEMAAQPLSLPAFEVQGMELRRKVFSTARLVELDTQGRIVLPDTHLEWSSLNGKVGEDVVVIGAGDHFQIWQRDNWEKVKSHWT